MNREGSQPPLGCEPSAPILATRDVISSFSFSFVSGFQRISSADRIRSERVATSMPIPIPDNHPVSPVLLLPRPAADARRAGRPARRPAGQEALVDAHDPV